MSLQGAALWPECVCIVNNTACKLFVQIVTRHAGLDNRYLIFLSSMWPDIIAGLARFNMVTWLWTGDITRVFSVLMLWAFTFCVRHVTVSSSRPAEPRGVCSSSRRWEVTAVTWPPWPAWLLGRTLPTFMRSRLTSETCRLNSQLSLTNSKQDSIPLCLEVAEGPILCKVYYTNIF